MLLDEFVTITVYSQNVRHFVECGYEIPKRINSSGKESYAVPCELTVKVSDLSPKSNTKVKIKCDYCGDEFYRDYATYLKGIKDNPKCACRKCFRIKSKETNLQKYNSYTNNKKTIDEVEKTLSEHGLLLLSTEYIDRTQPLDFICLKHRDFGKQTRTYMSLHIAFREGNSGCKCCGDEARKRKLSTPYDVVKKGFEERNCTLLTKEHEYQNGHQILDFVCNTHKDKIQKSSWNNFKVFGGCMYCRQETNSYGEANIKTFLDSNSENYVTQYIFDDCRDKQPLPFDFAIIDDELNVLGLIEYQGRQHYEPYEKFGGNEKFISQVYHDGIKVGYCMAKNIPLLTIPYHQNNDDMIINMSNFVKKLNEVKYVRN